MKFIMHEKVISQTVSEVKPNEADDLWNSVDAFENKLHGNGQSELQLGVFNRSEQKSVEKNDHDHPSDHQIAIFHDLSQTGRPSDRASQPDPQCNGTSESATQFDTADVLEPTLVNGTSQPSEVVSELEQISVNGTPKSDQRSEVVNISQLETDGCSQSSARYDETNKIEFNPAGIDQSAMCIEDTSQSATRCSGACQCKAVCNKGCQLKLLSGGAIETKEESDFEKLSEVSDMVFHMTGDLKHQSVIGDQPDSRTNKAIESLGECEQFDINTSEGDSQTTNDYKNELLKLASFPGSPEISGEPGELEGLSKEENEEITTGNTMTGFKSNSQTATIDTSDPKPDTMDTNNNSEHQKMTRESWRFCGLEFAPLFIPTSRRLQTASVMWYCCMFNILPVLYILVFLALLVTPLFFVSLGYATFIIYDVFIKKTSSRGGRRKSWMRNLAMWRYFKDYFPARLIKTTDLRSDCNYLFGYHPHGVIGCGALAGFGTEALGFTSLFPGITPYLMTLKLNFYLPVVRFFLLCNGICDVSKESIMWVLTEKGKGNAAIIVPGGAEEALEAHPGTYNLNLKNRKGFVKIALQTGSALVPVFAFGENDLFKQVDNPPGSNLRKLQEKVKQLIGISPPLIFGRGIFNYTFGFLPFRRPINIVVGSPIYLETCTQPSKQHINDVHECYMKQLSKLFDEHKFKYGVPEKTKLKFI